MKHFAFQVKVGNREKFNIDSPAMKTYEFLLKILSFFFFSVRMFVINTQLWCIQIHTGVYSLDACT